MHSIIKIVGKYIWNSNPIMGIGSMALSILLNAISPMLKSLKKLKQRGGANLVRKFAENSKEKLSVC
jgi:hypothetical protein